MENRIKELRAANGLSQKALAELVGIRYESVGAIERGKFEPQLETAIKIARVFGLRVEEVFLYKPPPDAEATRAGVSP